MVDNIGSWLSYVATLELVTQYSGGSGLAISAVVIIRFMPSLLLAPVCGIVADRVNRVRVLVAAALFDAAVVAALAAVPLLAGAQVPLLYVLLTLQFSAAAFYEPGAGCGAAAPRAAGATTGTSCCAPAPPPAMRHARPCSRVPTPTSPSPHPPHAAARKALVPVLVPADSLHLATTIDSFAWSITGAVGAGVGGVVASRLGLPTCFVVVRLAACADAQRGVGRGRGGAAAGCSSAGRRAAAAAITACRPCMCLPQDALTYLVAAWCARQIPVELGAPDAQAKQLKKGLSMRQVELAAATQEAVATAGSGEGRRHQRSLSRASEDAAAAVAAENGSAASGLTHAEHRHHHGTEAWEADSATELEGAPMLRGGQGNAEALRPGGSGSSATVPAGGSGALLAAAMAALAEGMWALREGWGYMRSRQNRDVAALVLMKCTAALTWGAGEARRWRGAGL